MPKLDQTRPFIPVRIAVLTVSDTRGVAEDKSGALWATTGAAEAITASGIAAADSGMGAGDGTGAGGAVGRKTPGSAVSAEKPQKVMTGLPSTT